MRNMWVVIEFIILASVVLFSITEFFYPLLMGKPLFGSFRKKGAAPRSTTLDEEILEARRKAADVRDVQRKAEEDLRNAEERKNAADDLLK